MKKTIMVLILFFIVIISVSPKENYADLGLKIEDDWSVVIDGNTDFGLLKIPLTDNLTCFIFCSTLQ